MLFFFLEALNVGLVEWKWYVCAAWYHSSEITIFVRQWTGAYANRCSSAQRCQHWQSAADWNKNVGESGERPDCRRKIFVIFTNCTHDIGEWRLINVWNLQYYGLKNVVGNSRNVTMDFATHSIFLSSGPCQIYLFNLKSSSSYLQTTRCGKNRRCSVRRLRFDRHTELVRFGAFVINNLHPIPKTNIGIANRKFVVHREILHVPVREPAHRQVVARL